MVVKLTVQDIRKAMSKIVLTYTVDYQVSNRALQVFLNLPEIDLINCCVRLKAC